VGQQQQCRSIQQHSTAHTNEAGMAAHMPSYTHTRTTHPHSTRPHLVHVAAELLVVALEPLHKLFGRDDARLLLGVLDLPAAGNRGL
jgi:hypothetical protein